MKASQALGFLESCVESVYVNGYERHYLLIDPTEYGAERVNDPNCGYVYEFPDKSKLLISDRLTGGLEITLI